jgi:hypothetical protein
MNFQIRLCSWLIVLSVVLTILCQSRIFMMISTATAIAMSVVGYFATIMMIPVIQQYMLKRNISGKDINKKGTEAG